MLNRPCCLHLWLGLAGGKGMPPSFLQLVGYSNFSHSGQSSIMAVPSICIARIFIDVICPTPGSQRFMKCAYRSHYRALELIVSLVPLAASKGLPPWYLWA